MTPLLSPSIIPAPEEIAMAYGDNRKTPKMNKRRAQLRKKARLARKAAAAKAARAKG